MAGHGFEPRSVLSHSLRSDLSSLLSSCTLRGYLLYPSVSHRSHGTEPGMVLTLGQGDVGQLGLGENVMERKKPALVSIPEDIVQAEAGGMHTVCLSKSGQVGQGGTRWDRTWDWGPWGRSSEPYALPCRDEAG